ncbi:hypothetical protein ACFSHP_21075 [Novosphingobium panipatense]
MRISAATDHAGFSNLIRKCADHLLATNKVIRGIRCVQVKSSSNQFRRNTSFTAGSTLFGWKRIDHSLYRQDLVRHAKVEERLFNDIVRNSGAMRRDVKNTTKMGLSYRGRVLGKYPAGSLSIRASPCARFLPMTPKTLVSATTPKNRALVAGDETAASSAKGSKLW